LTLSFVILFAQAVAPLPPPAPAPLPQPDASSVQVTPLDELSVTADEPRFVAPTRRDRIGRIWAPVRINGQGPFRLVLDTGASHSALTPRLAATLGIALDSGETVMLRGATGSVPVPMVPVETMEVGDLLIEPGRLPVVPDALGGAEGVLGSDGLENRRIHIDFRHDSITIVRSKNQRASPGFLTIAVKHINGRLLVVGAMVGGVPVKAVIDTGGQATLGNEALRLALEERRRRGAPVARATEITGATLDIQPGSHVQTPALALGAVLVQNPSLTFADFAIFDYWKMTDAPALLIGMDVLGLLDTLIIDYRRKELQVKLPRS
jgi:predicted aspartyl protease